MFKKTLLALALTGLAGVANAAEMTPTATDISIEGSAGAASVTSGTVSVALGAEYTAGDTVTFKLSGASINVAKSTALALAPATASDIVFGLLSATTDTITFRVTSVGASTTKLLPVELSGLELNTASVRDASGKVAISFAAATSTGLAIDSGTKSVVVANKIAQFSSSVTGKLDAVIDVENSRKQFTSTGTPATTTVDVLTITPKEETVSVATKATYTGAEHVIRGDFSWMDTDGTVGVSQAELDAAFAVAGATGTDDVYTAKINTAGDAITVTVADNATTPTPTPEVFTATFTVLGADDKDAPILASQDFTVDSTVKFNTKAAVAATKVAQAAEAAGSWKLNGFDQDITFMPFSDEYFQSITVSNTGDVVSTITVDITANGETETHELVAKAAAKSTTNISKEVKDFATADGVDGNAHVKVVVNSPAKDISVSGVYYHKADKDRVKTK